MKKNLRNVFLALALILLPTIIFAQVAPNLGTTSSFAFFTASGAFEVVGATTVTGDVGTDAGAFTAFPPGVLVGVKHVVDPIADQANIDVHTAYGYMSTLTCGHVLGTPILTQTLAPGVYCAGGAAVLAGDLTLDGGGDPDAKFYIKINGALATNNSTKIILTNGTKWSNVYWQINGEFTGGGSSVFQGTILGAGAITLNASTLIGRGLTTAGAISLNAANGMLPLPLTVTTTQVDAGCSPTGSATAIPAGGVPPYSYSWDTLPAQTTATLTGLAAGNYIVTVTDDAGTTATANVTITQPATGLIASLTSQVNVSCFGSTGSAVITPSGGTPPYVITPAQTGLSPGLHTFTVTDANLCTTTVDATITGPATGLTALLTSQVNVSCYGNNTGSAVITPSGGTPPYLITPAQTGLSAGLHTFTVTDANLCSATANVSIQQPLAGLMVNTLQTDVICFGEATGSATANATGGTAPYSYLWNTIPVQTTTTINDLRAGTYTVTVTDNSGCIAIANVIIKQPLLDLQVNPLQTDVLCFGEASGSATASPTGGTAPYTYLWNTIPVQTTATVNNLKAGTYTVEVTDSRGCKKTANVNIVEPKPITGTANVTIILNGSGGSTPLIFTLGNETNGTGIFTNVKPGVNYTWSITDGNKCNEVTGKVSLCELIINMKIDQVNVLCFGNTTGSATVTPTGGTGPYTYFR